MHVMEGFHELIWVGYITTFIKENEVSLLDNISEDTNNVFEEVKLGDI